LLLELDCNTHFNQQLTFNTPFMQKILHLTLKKPQFEVTFSQEKKYEFRRPSKWIESRLINKDYDFIKFTNGYGLDKPFFICEFLEWTYAQPSNHTYSNGLVVNVMEGYFQISLGKVIASGNIK
jgi:hypothetical protein